MYPLSMIERIVKGYEKLDDGLHGNDVVYALRFLYNKIDELEREIKELKQVVYQNG